MSHSSDSSRESGNTKQIPPAKHWCFTLNNYTQLEKEMFKNIDRKIVPRLIFQEEKGEEKETPHLQGYLEFASKKRPKSVFKSKRVHWEKRKGTIDDNIKYCSKDGDRIEGTEVYVRGFELPFVQKIDKFMKWQLHILDILKESSDDRFIHWYWDKKGGIGKTTFQKWIYTHMENVLICSGKAADMKYAVVTHLQNTKMHPKIILVNIPRSSLDYVSYPGIENVKDMFFHCGKYEGGQVCGPKPHMFVFANDEPKREEMSLCRWKITELKVKKL
jgi:hypothetical protein